MRERQHRRLHTVNLLCCHILRPSGEFQRLLRRKRQFDCADLPAEKRLCDGDSFQHAAPWQPRSARVSDREGGFRPVRQMTAWNFCLQHSFFIGNPKIFHAPLMYDENASDLFPIQIYMTEKFPEQPVLLHRQRADPLAVFRNCQFHSRIPPTQSMREGSFVIPSAVRN